MSLKRPHSLLSQLQTASSIVVLVMACVASTAWAQGEKQALESANSEPGNRGSETSVVEVSLNSYDPPAILLSSQQLILEQVEELVQAGELGEAITNLERLFEQGKGYVVAVGNQQSAGTMVVQRFIPLRQWVQRRLAGLLLGDSELQAEYQSKLNDSAKSLWERLRAAGNIEELEYAASRYAWTKSGQDLGMLLADSYLENGWSTAALQVCQQFCPDLRVVVGPSNADLGSLPWSLAWRQHGSKEYRSELLNRLERELKRSAATGDDRGRFLVQAIERLLTANWIAPDEISGELWGEWARAIIPVLAEADAFELSDIIATKAAWNPRGSDGNDWSEFGGNSQRNRLGGSIQLEPEWPTWSQTLPLLMATQDSNPASRPRVAESERATLPYFPVVAGDRVYVNAMTHVQAFDIATGESWPKDASRRTIYGRDSASASYLPLGYPLLGTPRGTLVVDEDRLFARMGEAVTGWANPPTSEESQSLIIGLDLKREAAMLPGFPIGLKAPQFKHAEFEGTPCVWGDLLIVAIATRDNVGLRRSVAAFDVKSGQLRWESKPLASGVVFGSEQANLISHQLLTVCGGRIFYNTNLGAVACLNPTDGSIVWLVHYKRHIGEDGDPLAPNRFRYRDVNPCLVSNELVYCAPQDCPEIFAIDSSTGDLVWATDSTQVPDAVHLLGAAQGSLIVSGDRITWIDQYTGRILARYPGSNTPARMNSLASPRGLGRGMVTADEVYWPIQNAIMAFATDVDDVSDATRIGQPKLLRTWKMGAQGSDGGNLIVNQGHLIYVSPMRIMAFRQQR
ncbi:MAG: PQQ-binding-like beta-propeller repeat protein [Pirellulaceae bacterium]